MGCGKRESEPAGAVSASTSPTANTPWIEAKLPMRPGRYALTLSGGGSSSAGTLVLKASLPTDRSPANGRAASAERLTKPLYGFVHGVDFAELSAPMPSKYVVGGAPPSPDSTDPIYPGVLLIGWKHKGQFVLVIGTLSNRRDGSGGLDGLGIGLFAEQVEGDTVRGSWDAFGRVHGGSGKWSAVHQGD